MEGPKQKIFDTIWILKYMYYMYNEEIWADSNH